LLTLGVLPGSSDFVADLIERAIAGGRDARYLVPGEGRTVGLDRVVLQADIGIEGAEQHRDRQVPDSVSIRILAALVDRRDRGQLEVEHGGGLGEARAAGARVLD